MQRLLLVCNALLALVLAFRLFFPGDAAAADMRPVPERGLWTTEHIHVRPIADDRRSGRRVRHVVVDFSAPLVVFPKDDPGAPCDAAALGLRLDPPAEFAAFWQGADSVLLTLREDLPPARRFRLGFAEALQAVDGRVLAGGFAREFSTPGVKLAEVLIDDQQLDKDATSAQLTVIFDMPVRTAEVRELLRVTDAADAAQAVASTVEQVDGDAVGEAFRLGLRGAPLPRMLDVVVAPGLVPVGGEVPTARVTSRRVTLTEELQIESVTADSDGIDVRCNRRVPLPAEGTLRVEPAVPFQVRRDGSRLRLLGEFAPGAVYTLAFSNGFPGDGRARLLRDTRRSVVMGDLPQRLQFAHGGTVLCASALPQVSVSGCNVEQVRVRVQRVHDNNLVRTLQAFDERVLAAGVERELSLDARRNEEWTQQIDLRDFAEGAVRGLYRIELRTDQRYWYPARRLVQVTDLGVTVRTGAGSAAVQVVDLASGAAVDAAAVTVLSASNQRLAVGATDVDGVAQLTWPVLADAGGAIGTTHDGAPFLVLVEKGADAAFVGVTEHAVELAEEGLGGRAFLGDRCEAWVWPSRGIARPGETVDVAVLARDARGGAVVGRALEVRWSQPSGTLARRQEVQSPGSGLLRVSLPLAEDAPTGAWRVQVVDVSSGREQVLGAAGFEVDAFVPNRLEVAVVDVSPLRFGELGRVRVRANWLDGAPAAGRPVVVRTRLLANAFAPPGSVGFAFEGDLDAPPPGELRASEGLLDARGEAEVVVPMPLDAAQQTLLAHFAIEVLDPSGRAVRAVAQRALLRAERHLGVRAAGDRVTVRLVDADGQPVDATEQVTLRVEERQWDWQAEVVGRDRWRWRTVVRKTTLREWPVALQDGQAVASIAEQSQVGWLVVTASLGGRTVEQRLTEAPQRPDRLRVQTPPGGAQPGAVAQCVVTAPAAARGFVTIESDRVHAAFTVALQRGDTTIEVPVPADLRLPNVHVVVTATRAVPQSSAGEGPAWIIGAAPLQLARPELRLGMSVKAPEKVLPEQELKLIVDAPGATAALAFVVDEGVLGVTGHADPDPLAFLLARRALATDGADLGVALLQQMTFSKGTKSGGDGDASGMAALLAGSINTRIRPLALAQEVALDASGRCEVSFRLPPYEGRVRAMVVAAGGDGCAAASAAVVVQAPLGLSLAGPRMVAPGDRFVVPVTVKNATGTPGAAVVELRGRGLDVVGDLHRAVPLQQGEIVTLDVECVAQNQTEPARLSVTALLGDQRRVEALEVPVRTAAVARRADFGFDLAQGGEVRIDESWQEVRGVVRVDRGPGPQLAPILDRLVQYPYGCLEQTTSKGMGLLSCQALLPRIRPDDAVLRENVPALVQVAVDRVLSMQLRRGGFGWWPGARDEYAFGSVHVLDFLVSAHEVGFDVADTALRRAVDRLEQMAKDSRDASLRAHAIEVLGRAGRSVQPLLDWLATAATDVEDRARLALAYARLGEAERARAMLRDDPEWPLTRGADDLLRSPLRARALWLRARQALDPADPELPTMALSLLRALLASSTTTQENAQCLRALAEYYRGQPSSSEPVRMTGSVDGVRIESTGGARELALTPGSVVRIDGGGHGFALVTLSGRGTPPQGGAADELVLQRTLVDVDTGEPVASCKRGRIYEVRIAGECPRGAVNVVFTDLLPACLEPERPAAGLRVELLPGEIAADHVERRDDRVLLFYSGALPARFELRHRVRAVFCGEFAVPALRVEAMYDPSIAGTCGGGAQRLEVLP